MSLAEVAKLAGVSPATVSRVLRHSARVWPETAEHVTRALATSETRPAGSRRSVRNRAGKGKEADCSIGIVTVGQTTRRSLHVPVIASFVASVADAARQHELNVLLDEQPGFDSVSRLMRNREIGGAILLVDDQLAASSEMSGWVCELAGKVPLVWALGSQFSRIGVDRVTTDMHCAGQMAAAYLVEQGCRRLAFVADSPRSGATRTCASGFVNTAYDRGLEATVYVLAEDDRDGHVFGGHVLAVRTLAECVRGMNSTDNTPQGIFALGYGLTMQLHPWLNRDGLGLGRQVCLVCCDNDNMRLSELSPKPTTFEVDTAEIAMRAVRRLLSRMAHPEENPVSMQVPPILVRSPDMAEKLSQNTTLSGALRRP